jgi:hypothetical protein
MAIYVVTISNIDGGWVENTNTYFSSDDGISKSHKKKESMFPSKLKAYESVRVRFSDLDFESDKVIFNGNEANSIFDLVKIIGSEAIH